MSDNEDQKVVPLRETGKQRSTLLNVGIGFTTLGMLVFIGAFGYGYFELSKINTSLASMVNGLQTQATNNQRVIADLQAQMQQVQAAAQNSQNLITDWKTTQQGNLAKWYVAEVQYLVRLANDHVTFTQNTSMAVTLLQRANQVLAGLNNADLMPIRQSITDALASLQSQPQVDVSQLYLVLTALDNQLNQLPLPATPLQKQDMTNVPKENQTGLSWWRVGLNNTWDALRKIVIVRYNVPTVAPLVLPEEKAYLFQNLHAQMQTAIWGALHGDWRVYQNSIAQSMVWIRQYFVLNAPQTQMILQRLQGLQHVNIQPPKANLSATLQLLDAYMNKSA